MATTTHPNMSAFGASTSQATFPTPATADTSYQRTDRVVTRGYHSLFPSVGPSSSSSESTDNEGILCRTVSCCFSNSHSSNVCQCACHRMKLRRSGYSSKERPQEFYTFTSVLRIVQGNLDNWEETLNEITNAILREKDREKGRSEYKNAWAEVRDWDGNTALLVSGIKLTKGGYFERAAQLAEMLIERGADVNAVNHENRTLLSYSVQYMDRSLQLTTSLLNYGATVWSTNGNLDPSHSRGFCSDSFGGNCNSAFTYYIRGIIHRRKFEPDCLRTLYLIAQVMGQEPHRMHDHVMNTMFNQARCFNIMGPLFKSIKHTIKDCWTQPVSLRQLCRGSIRKAVIENAGNVLSKENVQKLGLPPAMQSYVLFEGSESDEEDT